MEVKINIQREVLEDQVRNIIADNPNISMMDLLTQFGADPKSFGYSIYEIITMTPGMAGEVLIEEFEKDSPVTELIKNLLQHSQVDVNMIVNPKINFTALM